MVKWVGTELFSKTDLEPFFQYTGASGRDGIGKIRKTPGKLTSLFDHQITVLETSPMI